MSISRAGTGGVESAPDAGHPPRLTLIELRALVDEVAAASSLAQAAERLVARLGSALGAEGCAIYLTDGERRQHVQLAVTGRDRAGARVELEDGLVGRAYRRAEPVVSARGSRRRLAVPVIERSRHRVIGVLVVERGRGASAPGHDEDEVAFVSTLASQLGASFTQADIRAGLDRLDQDGPAGSIELEGIASARGIGWGTAVRIEPEAAPEGAGGEELVWDPRHERERLHAAIAFERAALEAASTRLAASLGSDDRAVLDAHALLLGSASFVRAMEARIESGSWARGAVRGAVAAYQAQMEESPDPYLRERAADIRDLGRRLIARLAPTPRDAPSYPQRTVLVAEEVGLVELLDAPLDRLAGLVSVRGTSASHVASLARALSIPAVFGVPSVALDRLHGREVIVDGDGGRVLVQPDAAVLRRYRQASEQRALEQRDLAELVGLPCVTRDGHRVRLLANSVPLADVARTIDAGAEGMGLFRSELEFMLRDRFPTEDEQLEIYARVLEAMAPRPVVLRTLDVGGDKFLPYFPIDEPNPFLGWRGIRVTLDQPDLMKTQVRAMLRAAARWPNAAVLLPMISGVAELREARALVEEARGELAADALASGAVPIGVMVEVPSAVVEIDKLVAESDFVSIGTNDLTQYLLAVDRNNARVAKRYDPLHPAVLRAISRVANAARGAGKPVTVCGEMAADPLAAVVLVGTGVDTLSVNPGSLLQIKHAIRSVTFATAVELAGRARDASSAAEVRAMLAEGLGSASRPRPESATARAPVWLAGAR